MPRYRFEDIAINSKEKVKAEKIDQSLYIGLEHLEPGCLSVKSWGSDVPIKGDKLVMHKGDVLFGKRNAYLRRAAIAPHDGAFSAHGMVLRPKENVIDSEFFPLFIASDYFFDVAIRISVGSLSPTVNWKDLKNIEFNIPPIPIQRELSKVLWAINDTKEAYRQLIQDTDELVKSQFIEMFGDPYEVIQNSNARISDVAKVQVGIVIKPTRFYASDDKGIRAFRSLNVSPFHVKDDSEWVYFSQDGMEKNKRTIAHVGDVLVVRSGAPGTSCVVDEKHDGCNVIDLIIAHPQKSKVLPEYLCAFTNFPHGKLQIEGQSRGVAQKHFNVSMYENMRIIVPPMEQQQKFVDFLSQSDKSKFVTCTINKLIEGMTLCLRKTIQLSR